MLGKKYINTIKDILQIFVCSPYKKIYYIIKIIIYIFFNKLFIY